MKTLQLLGWLGLGAGAVVVFVAVVFALLTMWSMWRESRRRR
jgi:hypothetical protein